MKLNQKCIKALLTIAEDLPLNHKMYIKNTDIPDKLKKYSFDDIKYSAENCAEYLKKYSDNIDGSIGFEGLTYEGHQVLDAMRNPKVIEALKAGGIEAVKNFLPALTASAITFLFSTTPRN